MNWDADAESAAGVGARRALAAMSHELSSPLTALYAFLKLATGDGLGPIRRCADRINEITATACALSSIEPADSGETDVVIALANAAAQLDVTVETAASGECLAQIAPATAAMIIAALMRAVAQSAVSSALDARVEHRGDRICVRIAPAGIEPASWRVVEPWGSGTGHKLDLWAGTVAAGAVGGSVRVGERHGMIAIELELPR